ncbi:MAG: hypothetical protein KatS3mg105_0212 [Gemmatales bacterium]|nr:MAG: hypothetical protein KatS3mg105_0212 [Gemmatales bacterium]
MTPQAYNFCKPDRIIKGKDHLASDMEQRLVAWWNSACELAPKKWQKLASTPFETAFNGFSNQRAGDILADLEETDLGYRVTLNGTEGKHCLLVLTRPLAIRLVALVTGGSLEEELLDRDLTVIEEAVADYVTQQLFLPSLQESWRETAPLELGHPAREANPKWSKVFAADEKVVVGTFVAKIGAFESSWKWILPQDELLKLVANEPMAQVANNADVLARLKALVNGIRVEIVVQLGSVQVPVAQLSRLRPGDLIMLDQSINEPITAQIAGIKKFEGWPGRVGQRQAFRISRLDG